MQYLTNDQELIIEEVSWLAELAFADHTNATGGVDVFETLSDPKAWEDIMPKVPERALKRFIDNLGDDDKAMLTALMVLGRNDNAQEPSDFPELVKQFRGDTDDTGIYLTEKAPLAIYLSDGLKSLRALA
jgi:hypothetical protein